MATASTLSSRQAKAQARKDATARMEAVKAAVSDEMVRFNAAISRGAIARLSNGEQVASVGNYPYDWMYSCPKANGGFGQTFYGANDGTWASLLAQAGVARHPLFA